MYFPLSNINLLIIFVIFAMFYTFSVFNNNCNNNYNVLVLFYIDIHFFYRYYFVKGSSTTKKHREPLSQGSAFGKTLARSRIRPFYNQKIAQSAFFSASIHNGACATFICPSRRLSRFDCIHIHLLYSRVAKMDYFLRMTPSKQKKNKQKKSFRSFSTFAQTVRQIQ